MYFCGEPLHDHAAITPPPPVVGVNVSVPPVADPSFILFDNVTVMTPLAPTFVLLTNCVGAAVPEHPA